MIDFETLGTHADAVIMSIGAVKFDLESDRIEDAAFYASISIDSNLDAGRRISEDTLLWWMKQSPEARAVFEEPKQSLETVLVDFADWWSQGDARFIWSNGASFDIPMMSHAYNSFGMDTPWQFFNERCVRTYKNLPGAKNIKVENAVKHNALSDAVAQVRLVQAIQRKLGGAHPMVKAAP
jgi:hypothetical protein